MATANIYHKIIYTGDGLNDKFSFNFPAPATSDISVYVKRGESGKQQKLLRKEKIIILMNINGVKILELLSKL